MIDDGPPEDPLRGGRLRRAARRLRAADAHPRALAVARLLRTRLPGDTGYGDPLSIAGPRAPQLLGQRLAALDASRPSALRELGFGALQAFQALSEAQGRGQGDVDVAIVFTDLVGFSAWALEAGDDAAVELLREQGRTVEPCLTGRGGEIVKRLGDGLMAVFPDADAAVHAALDAAAAGEALPVRLRAGVHTGRPRRLGGDYFGVDVNVAARVAAAAGPGEVLVSATAAERAGAGLRLTARRWDPPKGTPAGLTVVAATRPDG